VAFLKHLLLGSAASFGALVLSLFVEPIERPAPLAPTSAPTAEECLVAPPLDELAAPTPTDGPARERLAELLARRVLALVGHEPSGAARALVDGLDDAARSGT